MTRNGAAAIAATAALAVILVLVARRAPEMTPTSDMAVIELDTLLASRGTLLVGPYSRFQWHHPGPLYFLWMAPFYLLSGSRTTGLNAAALVLNLAVIALMSAVIRRRAGTPVVLLFVLIAGAFIWRAAGALTSPWNPHIPVFPLMALVVIAADTLSGTPAMLPVVAVLASGVAQTHVALLPSAFVLGVTALVGVIAQRGRQEPRRFRQTLMWTAFALMTVWLPPLIEQFTERPGNLTLLWKFFVTESHPGQPFAVAASAWSDMLSGLLRPDFYVAQGWEFRESPVLWAEAFALVQVMALVVAAAVALRRRRTFLAALACLLLLISTLSLWSATRIDGAIFDHEIFWIAAVGVLNTVVLVATAADLLIPNERHSVRPSTLVNVAGSAVVVLAALAGARGLRAAVIRAANPGIESETARAVAGRLQEYLVEQNVSRPLVRIDQDAWGMAAGVILDLYKQGHRVAVEDDWLVMFAPEFSATGQESAVLFIAGKAEHVRLLDQPGDTVVVAHEPLFVHRTMPPNR